jgi:hypothetical protein
VPTASSTRPRSTSAQEPGATPWSLIPSSLRARVTGGGLEEACGSL